MKKNTNERRHIVYVALGSNLGDRAGHLNAAIDAMRADERIAVESVSDYIVTKPVGPVEQPDFLNACARLTTTLGPKELLTVLQMVENREGRTREIHWGPRTLDLDILMYDDLVSDEPELVLPHPEMHKRLFVLEPMCEIAPDVVHPRSHRSMAELRDELMETERMKRRAN